MQLQDQICTLTLPFRPPLRTFQLCAGPTVRTCWVTSRYFLHLIKLFFNSCHFLGRSCNCSCHWSVSSFGDANSGLTFKLNIGIALFSRSVMKTYIIMMKRWNEVPKTAPSLLQSVWGMIPWRIKRLRFLRFFLPHKTPFNPTFSIRTSWPWSMERTKQGTSRWRTSWSHSRTSWTSTRSPRSRRRFSQTGQIVGKCSLSKRWIQANEDQDGRRRRGARCSWAVGRWGWQVTIAKQENPRITTHNFKKDNFWQVTIVK